MGGTTKMKNKTPQLDPLAELQKEFCLLSLDSQIRVGLNEEIRKVKNGQSDDGISMYQIPAGKLLMQRCLENLPVSTNVKDCIQNFMVSPKTLIYDKIAFTPKNTPKSTLNYWVEPSAGSSFKSSPLIVSFIKEVICNGDRNLFYYLRDFLAHMLQKPEEKPGVMIVLIGGQGTGKGTFYSLLRKIWPITTLEVSNIEHVTGGFNAALERNYVVCMDEALFSGQKQAMDRLKSLITEPSITIEQKYEPRRSLISIHRFFASSNHDHFGNIAIDDRRFVFCNVSDQYQGNYGYFKDLYDAINDPNQISGIIKALKLIDLSNFNIRAKPKTKELLQQKLKSLNGFERYWYEVLCSEHLDIGGSILPIIHFDSSSSFLSSMKLSEYYRNFKSGTRQYQSIQFDEIRTGIRKCCPSARKDRKYKNKIQERGYQLPSLITARKEFEKMIGDKINW